MGKIGFVNYDKQPDNKTPEKAMGGGVKKRLLKETPMCSSSPKRSN